MIARLALALALTLVAPQDPLPPAIVAVETWVQPQPKHSAGLLVNYGSQGVVEANADWHGYDLALVPNRCGLASISPAHLGRLAYVRTDGAWRGPCLVVDVVARRDAYGSIFERHEIAEVSRDMAGALNFEYGAQGEIWFSSCPPMGTSQPLPYAPPLAWDAWPYHRTPSLWPYPAQQRVSECEPDLPNGYHVAE